MVVNGEPDEFLTADDLSSRSPLSVVFPSRRVSMAHIMVDESWASPSSPTSLGSGFWGSVCFSTTSTVV